MLKFIKQLIKYIFLFFVGAGLYIVIELLFRGHSHWTMGILGGISFISIGLINEIFEWNTPLLLQCVIGGEIITIYELIAGIILNIWLGMGIWDYSHMPFNILGQISLSFTLAWCGLSLIGIILDDYLRYWFFNEDKPKYKIL